MAEAYFMPEHSVCVKPFGTATRTERFNRPLEKRKFPQQGRKGQFFDKYPSLKFIYVIFQWEASLALRCLQTLSY